MIFGGKAEYKKEELPFCYIKNKEDIELGGITIEAYGKIDGEMKYLSAHLFYLTRKCMTVMIIRI